MSALNDAIKKIGSQRDVARLCGVSQALVCKWANGSVKIGIESAAIISNASKGSVSCEELRPDVNWSILRK